jgi:hypothetical protein
MNEDSGNMNALIDQEASEDGEENEHSDDGAVEEDEDQLWLCTIAERVRMLES